MLIRVHAWLNCLVLLALALCAGGCSTYYGQAVRGQWQLLTAPQPISVMLERTNTPPALKAKLELVLRIRAFAEKELRLRPDGHYANYADLGRRHVVWNVYAAPEFSLEDKTWWYPIVGSLSYRGYFREDLARCYGERLARDGWDVHVGGVDAFSTLGWFRDPVLNTFIERDDTDLAELLFHELAHQRVFIAGDTDFNEAFASAVADEGVRRWLRANGNEAAIAAHEAGRRREEEFDALLQRTRGELESLYARMNQMGREAMREAKAKAFDQLRANYDELRQSWGGYAGYDGWFTRPINNARLNTVKTYHHLMPGFAALLARKRNDLEAFYREARELRRLKKSERHKKLEALSRDAKSP